MTTAIVWFRQDLRCVDNPALNAACLRHEKIIPLYILDSAPALAIGAAQHWWLHHSLRSLTRDLKQHGLELCLKKGDPKAILEELIKKHQVTDIYWNRCYEPAAIERDKQLKKCFKSVHSFNGSLLNEPWEIKNKSGNYFKVFTPYWKHCLKQMEVMSVETVSKWPTSPKVSSDCLEDWALLPSKPNWAEGFAKNWQPGEQGALDRLDYFISNQLLEYQKQRDVPALRATSYLSPHLHFGEISPRQIWVATQQAMVDNKGVFASAEHFLSELGWREFSYYLLYHYPQLPDTNFNRRFDVFPWQVNDELLACWQKGITGYPIVDAGMRELWHTGYMHNRVRMITASFLTKDLFIDWREGAAWFWDCLLDADAANNSASWQWVAGCGADAAPYFRIFNPVIQGERFDPLGEYIKHWIPELKELPLKWIHKPWEAPENLLPKNYPKPVVDHATARKQALAYYQDLKKE